jgi:uncharacterized protein
MRCPVDNETLVMADRNGVEIDYCPKCRGVWLDRGELDKIIERGSATPAPQRDATPVYQPEPVRSVPQYREEPRRHREEEEDRRYPKKRRESFLSDLFDF